jgi:hypothetical protein
MAPVFSFGSAASGGVVLHGVRGIGKTSVLRAVRAKARSNYGFISTWSSASKRGSLLETFPDAIRRTLVDNDVIKASDWSLKKMGLEFKTGIVNAKLEATQEKREWEIASLESLLRQTAIICADHGQKRGSGFLWFVDELHAVSQNELAILLNALQNITDDEFASPPFMFLGAGLPSVRGIATRAATFGERTLFREITSLTEQDTKTALEAPALSQGVTFSQAAIEKLVAQTKGYPFFVQLFGFNTWKVAKPVAGDVISIDQVLNGIEETKSDVIGLFNARFDSLTRSERQFVSTLARISGDQPAKRSEIAAELNKDTSAISMVRRQLMAKAIITEHDHGFVQFTLPGFSDFILSETM